jgi:formylglycine-generating enzyme required for sulfatase activity
MRRLALILGLLGLLAIVGGAVWAVLDLPPLPLVLSHGLPPAGGPTGRRVTIEGVEFVEIWDGYFRMGSWFLCDRGDLVGRICARFKLPWGRQPKTQGWEVPVHWVRIRRSYWIALTEVTNAEYERFDPEHGRDEWAEGDRHPVVNVSFEDAQRYCAWLTARGTLEVRLPSEGEWEYACRAGSEGEYCFGDDRAMLAEYAWSSENRNGRLHEVATRSPNRWGLNDLHGNVREWCEDRWHDDYEGAPDDGTAWTEGASPFRVDRGGDWRSSAVFCRSAFRLGYLPSDRSSDRGFRPAASSD